MNILKDSLDDQLCKECSEESRHKKILARQSANLIRLCQQNNDGHSNNNRGGHSKTYIHDPRDGSMPSTESTNTAMMPSTDKQVMSLSKNPH